MSKPYADVSIDAAAHVLLEVCDLTDRFSNGFNDTSFPRLALDAMPMGGLELQQALNLLVKLNMVEDRGVNQLRYVLGHVEAPVAALWLHDWEAGRPSPPSGPCTWTMDEHERLGQLGLRILRRARQLRGEQVRTDARSKTTHMPAKCSSCVRYGRVGKHHDLDNSFICDECDECYGTLHERNGCNCSRDSTSDKWNFDPACAIHGEGDPPSDPTSWRYSGASEEALLAVEAMGEKVDLYIGVTVDERRVYRFKEKAQHRPFEVVFDAMGGEVDPGDVASFETVGTTIPGGIAILSMARDLLAALVVKLDRAAIGYLCRGCGELDPPDMHDNWHVVLGEDHDPNDPHHDGECRSCPIQVQEQCGPIVQVGGRG